jgi:alpha-glucosidase
MDPIQHAVGSKEVILQSPEGIKCAIQFYLSIRLFWFWPGQQTAFLSDFKTSYMYDKRSGRMFHHMDRQGYMPRSEMERSANDNHLAPHPLREEFVYGLGETKGPMMKTGKRYVVDARDSLSYDVEETDPLYKLHPFYMLHNSTTKHWYGMYYNSLQPGVAEFGAEHDFSTGFSHYYSPEQGALDYYVLLGESSICNNGNVRRPIARPHPRTIIRQFAQLVTPFVTPTPLTESDKKEKGSMSRNLMPAFAASPSLPRLSSFGYLASSLTLSERDDAQVAIKEYISETRRRGFPVDGMHLSSGYCINEENGERNYFIWNRKKYTDPASMGKQLELEGQCHLIVNVKPWLLEDHPWYQEAALEGALVLASRDAVDNHLASCVGVASASRTLHWSSTMGVTALGTHFDFSSQAGAEMWGKAIRTGITANNISGLWIDNNEFSTLIDDGNRLKGEVALWAAPKTCLLPDQCKQESNDNFERIWARQVQDRMGWTGGEIQVGAVGRAVLTMGMAKASWEHMARADPHTRPLVVTRSAVPGIQAYAHGTWSGDNGTTWKHLKWNTKMTLGMGLSFGPGLYGHDIGGFSGDHSPSPEFLVRFTQQSMWHSRFTLHSWKRISTTFYMYKEQQPEAHQALLDAVQFRYQLIPTLYSLYVAEYHRKGWPVLRPLLWCHSFSRNALTQDEQFLLGDTLLVAPVLEPGMREITFSLPHRLDACEQRRTASMCWWYDMHGERWIKAVDEDATEQEVTLSAPLNRCPALMRENGILVLADGETKQSVFDQFPRHNRRIQLFPAAIDRLKITDDPPAPVSFSLVEDDGVSNKATAGAFNEIIITCQADERHCFVDLDTRHRGHKGTWQWTFELPKGDTRQIVITDRGSITANRAMKENRVLLNVQICAEGI